MAPNLDIRWQDQNIVKKDGQWTVDGRPLAGRELVAHESPSNLPDHYYIGMKLTLPVDSATPPHTHGGASIHATVTKGRVLNQTVCPHHDPDSQGDGPKFYDVGDSWYEPPGCHHVRSENAGDGEAEFVAWFVVHRDTVDKGGMKALVVIDKAVEEEKEKEGK